MSKPVTKVTELTDASLWCRTENHRFKWQTDKTTVNAKGELIEVVRWFECEECGVLAKRQVKRTRGRWHAEGRKITHYPDGYLLKGLGRLHKDTFYSEFFERNFTNG